MQKNSNKIVCVSDSSSANLQSQDKSLNSDSPYSIVTYKSAEVRAAVWSPIEGRLSRGRLVVADSGKQLQFTQDPPRGKRNKQICRTNHISILLKKDGRFGGTIIIDPTMKYTRETLIAELREVCQSIDNYIKTNKQ